MRLKIGTRLSRQLRMLGLLSGRAWLAAFGHATVFALVYGAAFALRFDGAVPPQYQAVLEDTIGWVVLTKVMIFFVARQYQHACWFHATFADLLALLRTSLLTVLAIGFLGLYVLAARIPLGVLLLDGGLTILALAGLATSGRIITDHLWPAWRKSNARAALVVGGDRAAALVAQQINARRDLPYRVRGFLAVQSHRLGQRLGQLPVLGHVRDVVEVAGAHGISDILVVAGSITGRRLRHLRNACSASRLELGLLPPAADFFHGRRSVPTREVDLAELLPRAPVSLETEALHELITGRRVLITGAGGSIGSELCRQALAFHPAEIVLLGRGENRIWAIERELRATRTNTRFYPAIANVTNEERLREVFEQYRPEVVLHTAAHKHVPLMELSVGEAIRNNVLGTRCVAEMADEYACKHFVLVSTDKAVNPSSIMGATKHLAEHLINTMVPESLTRFVVVRLGNVLGSAGSVVPVFLDQIRRGGPITITDPRMTRYFMLIPEAAQLILQAAALGRGGEIFVLDMGAPVPIVDLAQNLIRLCGLPPQAIEIVYTGIRQGEKLHEELYAADELTQPTRHPKLRMAAHRPCDRRQVTAVIDGLLDALGLPEEALREMLLEAIPSYRRDPLLDTVRISGDSDAVAGVNRAS